MPIRTASMRTPHALLLACCAFSLACAGGETSDQARPEGAIAGLGADSARIMDELRHLSSDSMRGRGTGTAGAARAAAYLARALADAGAQPVGAGFEFAFEWKRVSSAQPRHGVNVVGVVPGAELAGSYIVVSAHYDHLGIRNGEIYNGADDDASGCVALLALARVVRAFPLRHSLLLVSFDAEETGLHGSRAFVSRPPVPLASIALDLNMDMVARTAGVLWAAGAHHTPALRPVLERVAAEAPLDLRLGHDAPGAPGGEDWTHSSDHGPFHDAGIPFVYLGVDDHADYHRPTDDFENIDPGAYMDALRTALLTLLALDRALPFAAEPPAGTPAAGDGERRP